MGGSLFMGVLTLLFLIILVIAVINAVQIVNKKHLSDRQLDRIKSVGLFTMVFGILGQMIGLFEAFEAIEHAGEISQSLLAGGLRVSSITTIYGILIFLISYLIWFAETVLNKQIIVD
jgi:biopolymer transport protein ExbB/TolQ